MTFSVRGHCQLQYLTHTICIIWWETQRSVKAKVWSSTSWLEVDCTLACRTLPQLICGRLNWRHWARPSSSEKPTLLICLLLRKEFLQSLAHQRAIRKTKIRIRSTKGTRTKTRTRIEKKTRSTKSISTGIKIKIKVKIKRETRIKRERRIRTASMTQAVTIQRSITTRRGSMMALRIQQTITNVSEAKLKSLIEDNRIGMTLLCGVTWPLFWALFISFTRWLRN